MSFRWSGNPLSALVECGLVGVFLMLGFYGAYLIVFSLAMCSAWRSGYTGRARIRIPLILMFMVVTACIVMRIIMFCVNISALADPLDDNTARQTINMVIAINVLTCLAGLLSDAVLAWRGYVLFGSRPWTKWLLSAAVLSNFAGGSLANIGYAAAMSLPPTRSSHIITNHAYFAGIALGNKCIVIWAWYFLAINTALTASIVFTIVRSSGHYSRLYTKIISAVVESSLISWIGLLGFGVSGVISLSGLRPFGDTLVVDTFAVLPLAFGLSQSLIIARLGLSQYARTLASTSRPSALVFASDTDRNAPTELGFKLGHRDIELGTVSTHTTE